MSATKTKSTVKSGGLPKAINGSASRSNHLPPPIAVPKAKGPTVAAINLPVKPTVVPKAITHPAPLGLISDDAQTQPERQRPPGVVGTISGGDVQGHAESHAPSGVTPEELAQAAMAPWRSLRGLAECLDDAQKARISIAHKLRHQPIALAALHDAPKAAEDAIAKEMKMAYRLAVPKAVRDWQKATGGIGEHLLARLLGQIGPPNEAWPSHWAGTGANRVLIHDDPHERTLRQLWAYCGHGDPTLSRRAKGVTAEDVFAAGNPKAKMLVHLLAEAAIKQSGRRWTPELGGHWATTTDLGGDAHGSDDRQATDGVIPETNLDGAQTGSESLSIHGAVDPSPVESTTQPKATSQPAPRDHSAATQLTAESQRVFGGGNNSGSDAHANLESHVVTGVWPGRLVYERARDRYVGKLHETTCVRCGPSGHPAQPGTPWSAAHQHAAALRLVGKEMLRSLWLLGAPEREERGN